MSRAMTPAQRLVCIRLLQRARARIERLWVEKDETHAMICTSIFAVEVTFLDSYWGDYLRAWVREMLGEPFHFRWLVAE